MIKRRSVANAKFRVAAQARSIGLVRGEIGERDEAPRDVVRTFVRQEVADEVAAAAGMIVVQALAYSWNAARWKGSI